MTILVTGGLGFIGSHTVVELIQQGHDVVIVDNCSNSTTDVLLGIKKITGVLPVHKNIDITDADSLSTMVAELDHSSIDALVHFAAKKSVSESITSPMNYYYNNVLGTMNLMTIVKELNIDRVVFSSSCTVYGTPEALPVNESESIKPATSTYGTTKQMCEQIIRDFRNEHKFTGWLLRYFNPTGAHSSGHIGELPYGVPDNLVPYITQTAAGKRECLTIYGNDYDTLDGTCIRDYIHVVDLAKAHVAAVNNCTTYDVGHVNLGTGTGYSVKQMVDTFERVNNVKLEYKFGPRRPGDTPEIYCDTAYAKLALGWEARLNLDDMMLDAWNWQTTIL